MAFTTTHPLRFGQCDPSGIAYFPAYLDILVGVIEEFFGSIGAPWPELFGKRRIACPTVRLDLTFRKPGRHGDALEFRVQVRGVGRSSLDLEHQVSSGGAVLWTAQHRIVATNLDTTKAIAWPDDVRAALAARLEPADAHSSAT